MPKPQRTYRGERDKMYTKERNKLIPQAAKYADERLEATLSNVVDVEERSMFWNRVFLKKMASLSKEAGLTSFL